MRLGLHPQARKMKGDLAEVIEIRDDFDGETYRTMYTAKLGARLYFLHAFQKKAHRGIATPKSELDVIRRRLREARTLERIFKTSVEDRGA